MNSTFKINCVVFSGLLALSAATVYADSHSGDATTADEATPTTVEACLEQVEKMKDEGMENTDEYEAVCLESVDAMKMGDAVEGDEQKTLQPTD